MNDPSSVRAMFACSWKCAANNKPGGRNVSVSTNPETSRRLSLSLRTMGLGAAILTVLSASDSGFPGHSRLSLAQRIVHVQDAPASAVLPAHGHAASDKVFLGRDNFVVVGVPKRIAKEFYVVQLHLVTQLWRILQETPLQIVHDFLAAAVFSLKREKNDFRSKHSSNWAALPDSNAAVQ